MTPCRPFFGDLDPIHPNAERPLRPGALRVVARPLDGIGEDFPHEGSDTYRLEEPATERGDRVEHHPNPQPLPHREERPGSGGDLARVKVDENGGFNPSR